MRKQSLFTALMFTFCSLVILMAVYSFTRKAEAGICNVTDEQTEKLKPLNGKMLWESLSSQFVSSVHY